MGELARAGFPCPAPLAGPMSLGRGLATVEALLERGVTRSGHEPEVRRELAARLYQLTRLVPATAGRAALGPSWFSGLGAERLWPRPHSPLFDFERSAAGAEAIDALARAARAVPRAGASVVGHFDWRAEHARFEGPRLVAAFDWDSLHVDREPVVAGAAAHAFSVDWRDADAGGPSGPSGAQGLAQTRAFIADYEAARGRPFEGDERRTLGGALVYSLAYAARCTHALGAAASPAALAFRARLLTHGAELLQAL
jgi:hypothetical protein